MTARSSQRRSSPILRKECRGISLDNAQRLVPLATAWAGENHQFDIVGDVANSNDRNGSEIVWFAVAFQPDLGAPIDKDDFQVVFGKFDITFHHPVLPLILNVFNL